MNCQQKKSQRIGWSLPVANSFILLLTLYWSHVLTIKCILELKSILCKQTINSRDIYLFKRQVLIVIKKKCCQKSCDETTYTKDSTSPFSFSPSAASA